MKRVVVQSLLLFCVLLTSCVTYTGKLVPTQQQGRIPDLAALDQYGRRISLRKAAAQSDYLLVFFYPEADTPG